MSTQLSHIFFIASLLFCHYTLHNAVYLKSQKNENETNPGNSNHSIANSLKQNGDPYCVKYVIETVCSQTTTMHENVINRTYILKGKLPFSQKQKNVYFKGKENKSTPQEVAMFCCKTQLPTRRKPFIQAVPSPSTNNKDSVVLISTNSVQD